MKTIVIELSDSDARLWHEALIDAVNRRRTARKYPAPKLSKDADLNFVAEAALRYLIADEMTSGRRSGEGTMSNQTYTIEELEALPDADLCALAAELRGYRFVSPWLMDENNEPVTFGGGRHWTPATDRNQSGELLEWARRTHGALFRMGFTGGASAGYVQLETPAILRTISGTSARSETIAFCAAMLAQQGRLK